VLPSELESSENVTSVRDASTNHARKICPEQVVFPELLVELVHEPPGVHVAVICRSHELAMPAAAGRNARTIVKAYRKRRVKDPPRKSSCNVQANRSQRRDLHLRSPLARIPEMKTLFDSADRNALESRLMTLKADSPRLWGKMSSAQMLCHCATALETGTGDRPMKQKLMGKLLMPFFRSSILGEKPFSRNSPTDPTLVVSDERDFTKERERLLTLIERFVRNGAENAGKQTHSFFGKMTGQEWGELMHKHIDHHLRQFGC
jgi:hypothetical protein